MMSNGYGKRAGSAARMCVACAVLIMGRVLPAVAESATPRAVESPSAACDEELDTIECLVRREKKVNEFILELKKDESAELDGKCKVSRDTRDGSKVLIEAVKTYKGMLTEERKTRSDRWEKYCKKSPK